MLQRFSIALEQVKVDKTSKKEVKNIYIIKSDKSYPLCTQQKKSLKKYMTVSSYHVTHAFLSESLLYSFLNINELLAQNRRDISSLSAVP